MPLAHASLCTAMCTQEDTTCIVHAFVTSVSVLRIASTLRVDLRAGTVRETVVDGHLVISTVPLSRRLPGKLAQQGVG